jgi:hypothetical protein
MTGLARKPASGRPKTARWLSSAFYLNGSGFVSDGGQNLSHRFVHRLILKYKKKYNPKDDLKLFGGRMRSRSFSFILETDDETVS